MDAAFARRGIVAVALTASTYDAMQMANLSLEAALAFRVNMLKL